MYFYLSSFVIEDEAIHLTIVCLHPKHICGFVSVGADTNVYASPNNSTSKCKDDFIYLIGMMIGTRHNSLKIPSHQSDVFNFQCHNICI